MLVLDVSVADFVPYRDGVTERSCDLRETDVPYSQHVPRVIVQFDRQRLRKRIICRSSRPLSGGSLLLYRIMHNLRLLLYRMVIDLMRYLLRHRRGRSAEPMLEDWLMLLMRMLRLLCLRLCILSHRSGPRHSLLSRHDSSHSRRLCH